MRKIVDRSVRYLLLLSALVSIFVVFLIGLAYGPRLAAATVVYYLAQGAIGLPVLSGPPERGIGLAYMIGPTGGYLLGFVLAAMVVGWVSERRRDTGSLILALIAATLAIYIPGFLWLASLIGPEKALQAGVMPFLLGDVVKLALAAALGHAGLALLRRRLGV